MHGTDIDIGFAGYIADGANKPGLIYMVAEKEISPTGHYIHPEVIKLDNVYFTISNCARYCGDPYIGIDLQCE